MNIPKEFELIDTLIKVELNKSLKQNQQFLGFADYINNKIILDDSEHGKLCQDECFFHELVHWILFKMGNSLESDESFVSLFGSILHQSFKTMKY